MNCKYLSILLNPKAWKTKRCISKTKVAIYNFKRLNVVNWTMHQVVVFKNILTYDIIMVMQKMPHFSTPFENLCSYCWKRLQNFDFVKWKHVQMLNNSSTNTLTVERERKSERHWLLKVFFILTLINCVIE